MLRDPSNFNISPAYATTLYRVPVPPPTPVHPDGLRGQMAREFAAVAKRALVVAILRCDDVELGRDFRADLSAILRGVAVDIERM